MRRIFIRFDGHPLKECPTDIPIPAKGDHVAWVDDIQLWGYVSSTQYRVSDELATIIIYVNKPSHP